MKKDPIAWLDEMNNPHLINKNEVTLNILNENMIPVSVSPIVTRRIFDMRIYYTMGEVGEDMITKADSELSNLTTPRGKPRRFR